MIDGPSQGETTKPVTQTTPVSSTTTTVTTTTQTKPSETTTVSTTSTARQVEWGDANEDGKVDVSDAVLISRFIAEDKTAKITSQGQMNSNVAGTPSITSDSTIKILQYIAKIITKEELAPPKK